MDKAYKKMYKIKKIAPNVYGIGCGGVVMFLITGDKRALLVDASYGFTDHHAIIRSITQLPFDVVNTHGHIDHAGGNFLFREEKIYMHPLDVEVYRLHTSPEYRRAGVDSLRKLQRILFWVNLVPKKLDIDCYCTKQINEEQFHFVKEGFQFSLGGITVQVVELPGHTPGSIGLLILERRIIITSDAANPGTWLFLPESMKLSVYQHTLRKLEMFEFDHILTGHSTELYGRTDLANWIAVAENLDFENGKKQGESMFSPSIEARSCKQKGKSKNKASIAISAEKL